MSIVHALSAYFVKFTGRLVLLSSSPSDRSLKQGSVTQNIQSRQLKPVSPS